MIIGILLSAVFAESTAYSGMKSGLTVSAEENSENRVSRIRTTEEQFFIKYK